MRRVPVRWKLTTWYGAYLALVLLILGVGLYAGLRDRLYQSLDEQVAVQAQLARQSLELGGGEPRLPDTLTLLDDDAAVRILSTDGEVTSERGPGFDHEPVDSARVRSALDGETVTDSVRGEESELRLMTSPVREGPRVVAILQVALPADDVQESLGQMVSLLLIAAPLMLVLAVAGGYLLAGRALSPVVTISRLAARIGERDLSERIGLDLPDDELGHLAATFDAMLARIEDAFERQRRFSGDVAHELRTPLGSLRAQVDVALSRPRLPADYRLALQRLDVDLERMTRLVATLLTLARVDSGQLAPEAAAFDLAETIEMVSEHYAGSAGEAGIALHLDSASTRVVADEALLIQVMVILLDNALSHTPAHGRITIGCRPEGARVRLWVADTGPGIPPEHRARVFDRFYRVDTGRTREQGGTGLGLAIAKAIVEAHRGTIEVSGDPGARFDVVLPAIHPNFIPAP